MARITPGRGKAYHPRGGYNSRIFNSNIGYGADQGGSSTPACPLVTGLTSSGLTDDGVTLEWTETGDFDIYYGLAPLTPPTSGTTPTTTSNTNSKAITGLDPDTEYDFYVRTNCGSSKSAWSGPVTVTTINPYITAGANRAWSVSRKLYAAYAGNCIKVRRSSDNALLDIGFNGNDLDTTALLAHCGVGNGFVHTLYDQSGNGKILSQITNNIQPQIVASGVVLTRESKPSMYFPTAGMNLIADTANDWGFLNDGSVDYSVYSMAQFGIVDNPGADYGLFGTNGGTTAKTGVYAAYIGASNNFDFLLSNSLGSGATAPIKNLTNVGSLLGNQFGLVKILSRPTNATLANRSEINFSEGTIYKNNVSNGACAVTVPNHPFQLGGYGNFADFKGYVSELYIYPSIL